MKEKCATGPNFGLSFASRVCLHIQTEQNPVPLMLWVCPYCLPELAWPVKPVLFKAQLRAGVEITSLPALGVGRWVCCYVVVSKERGCDSPLTCTWHDGVFHRILREFHHTKSRHGNKSELCNSLQDAQQTAGFECANKTSLYIL